MWLRAGRGYSRGCGWKLEGTNGVRNGEFLMGLYVCLIGVLLFGVSQLQFGHLGGICKKHRCHQQIALAVEGKGCQ